jgi:hypothetical protein
MRAVVIAVVVAGCAGAPPPASPPVAEPPAAAPPPPDRRVDDDCPEELIYGYAFGRSGAPPAAGTIGTSAPPPPTTPAYPVAVATPAVTGGLDPLIVRRYLKRQRCRLARCAAGMAGTITADFWFDVDGRVTASSAQGGDDTVGACVASVIQAIEFPRPRGSASVHVTADITFTTPD